MDINEWLRSRRPVPPDQLMARMQSALSNSPSTSLSESLIGAATRILADAAHSERANERATALDLLAADALITYAVEAAADDQSRFTEETDAIIKRVAEISRT